MAYSEGGENFALLKRTVAGARDFSGRSSRTEVLYYCIATGLLGSVLKFTLSTFLGWRALLVADTLLECLIALPLFALFTRRLHDQDRSGRWLILFLFAFSVGLAQSLRIIMVAPDQWTALPLPKPLGWGAGLAYLATLILFFLPGTPGDNGYGSNPRLGDAAVAT